LRRPGLHDTAAFPQTPNDTAAVPPTPASPVGVASGKREEQKWWDKSPRTPEPERRTSKRHRTGPPQSLAFQELADSPELVASDATDGLYDHGRVILICDLSVCAAAYYDSNSHRRKRRKVSTSISRTPPPTADLVALNDSVKAFLDPDNGQCELGEEHSELFHRLFSAYTAFCASQRPPLSSLRENNFGRELRRKFSPSTTGDGLRKYVGVTLAQDG
jgi:hypothetical protein